MQYLLLVASRFVSKVGLISTNGKEDIDLHVVWKPPGAVGKGSCCVALVCAETHAWFI